MFSLCCSTEGSLAQDPGHESTVDRPAALRASPKALDTGSVPMKSVEDIRSESKRSRVFKEFVKVFAKILSASVFSAKSLFNDQTRRSSSIVCKPDQKH